MANDGPRTLLLLDGDVMAFRAASAVQHQVIYPSGMVEPMARTWEGESAMDNMIDGLKRRLKADDIRVFLSCPTADNWRLKVDPNYKSNRKDSVRPMLLQHLKEYLMIHYGAETLSYLEADDAIGIWGTSPGWGDTNVIIVGRDKDFATIPGQHYQLGDDDEKGKPIVRTVTAKEGAEWHYVQSLSGDAVDGYPGCPGIGKLTAQRIVENPVKLVRKEGVIPRGKNKGQTTIKWFQGEPCSIWEAIVCNYEKAGQTEADALRSARLARILQWGEYDFETHTVTLWVPGQD